MRIKQTVQDAINKNAANVAAWELEHNEKTMYQKSKPALRILKVFLYTSIGIWLKALFTGKMSLKNIGIVLITAIPLMVIGTYTMNVWTGLGIQIFYLGHTILYGTILLLFPVNAIKVMFWMMKTSFEDASKAKPQHKYGGTYDPDACCGPSYDEWKNNHY